MLKEAITKSQERIDFVLLDWKGLGEHKQKTLDLLKRLGLKFERTSNVEK